MSDKAPGKSIVLTGVKPTGQPHIGNYLGAIRPAIEMSRQANTETWLFIADYHALTSLPDPKKMREMTYELAAIWLASGLDPAHSVLYRQSDVPEVMELNWVLACCTAKGLMNRAHAYKAKVQENQEAGKDDPDFGVNIGLYTYPVLMSADILMFNADKVPVGEDQVQHLEYARDIAQKFNRTYGNVLKIPAHVVQKANNSVPGLDGRKMSKSYDNQIPLYEESARLKKLVARVKTDSLPPEAPKPIEGSIIFDLYQGFATSEQIEAFRAKFAAGISYGAAKQELFEVMDAYLTPGRERFKQLMNDRAEIDRILREGAERARAAASANLKRVRQAIGID